jgi:elongator complex protein 3
MAARGQRCRCIRCREVRLASEGRFALTRRDADASGGREIFLSFEDAARDRLAALLRLRIPDPGGPAPVEALRAAGLIRELHTYGEHLPLGAHPHPGQAAQHRGFGAALMAEAERLASTEFGVTRVAAIAGVGVREYYRKLGYRLEQTYMVKDLRAGRALNQSRI